MLNRVLIQGRLTRDPEMRYTQSNTPVASFTVACERDYSGDSGERATDFIDCVAWKGSAEFVCKYFRKGQMMLIEGRLQSRKWTDKQGNNRTSWEVIAEHTYFGEPKREDQPSGGNYAPPANTAQPQSPFTELPDDDGELPF